MGASGSLWVQSALAPAGPQAARIENLWWVFLGVSTVVFVAVALALGLALFRRRRVVVSDPANGEPRKVRVVTAATAVTVVILLLLITVSVLASRPMSADAVRHLDPLIVDVVGHQWWWEIQYDDPVASQRFRTANELHIPVGRPVIVRLNSRDVIHSFWVPNLHGKMDLVPGRTTTTWLQADRPGTYRGQCAEFCGLQHARMAFVVVAEPAAEYDAWARRQREPAPEPADDVSRRGREVFLGHQCALCHTIRGTGAWGSVAPDLTWIGSRRTLAAGTLPNTRGHLGGWLIDPQRIKPGNFMPPTRLAPEDLEALLTYLGGLR